MGDQSFDEFTRPFDDELNHRRTSLSRAEDRFSDYSDGSPSHVGNRDNPVVKIRIHPASSSPLMSHSASTNSSGIESPAGSDSPASSVQSPPTPMPHTPFFSPGSLSPTAFSGSPGSQDPSHNLPEPLLKAGWRRFYSRREHRWYFFNKFTQQSRWEMPEAEDAGRKRPAAEELSHSQPPTKKFVPSTDWDLTVSSNIQMNERIPFCLYPPHPDTEIKRFHAVMKIRNTYAELCSAHNGVELSADSLHRWFLERQTKDIGRDPFLPSDCAEDVSPSLFRDLSNSVPIKLHKMTSIPEARRQLSRYTEGARTLGETSRSLSAEERKQVKWQCEAMFDWLRNSQYGSKLEEYLNRLKFLKTQCQPLLSKATQPAIESICRKLMAVSKELVDQLHEDHKEMLLSARIDVSEDELPAPRADKIVTDYSAQLRFASPRLPALTMEQSADNWVKIKYNQDGLRINAAHFYKLEQLYRYNCFDDRRYDLFLARVWTLMKRYQCVYGPGPNEGTILQRSLPVPTFEILKRDFGVTFECFASPVNSYFRQFCSPFPDTDGYFGSRGSFLDFHPLSGSLVAHPPFCEELISATANHVVELLENSEPEGVGRPLSFVVFLPDWQDPPLPSVTMLENSRFFRNKAQLPAYDHVFRHGGQQFIQKKEELYGRSGMATVILWLQNEAAAQRWPAREDLVKALVLSFKPTTPAAPDPVF